MKTASSRPPDREAHFPVMDPARLSVAEIEQQLGRILESEPFVHSERLRRFLDFIVRRSLQNDQAGFKQSTIASHVFDRRSFDPDTDPIVRVEAGRLRARLREYYSTTGARDPVWIGLPARGYVPIFKSHSQPVPAARLDPTRELAILARSPRPRANTVCVLPFGDLSPAKTFGYFCDALTHQVIEALFKQAGLKVTARSAVFRYKGHSHDIRDIGRDLDVAMVLEGSVEKRGSGLRISALLADCETRRHLWANSYDRALDDIFAIQDEISAGIARDLTAALRQEQAS